MSVYKLFTHQHLHEICQTLNELRPETSPAVCDTLNATPKEDEITVDFVPYRGDFTRGIFCTEVIKLQGEEGSASNPTKEQLVALYKDFFKDAAFTHYVDSAIDMKQIVGTNKALIHLDKFNGNKVVVTSMIDNLLKGAVGKAVQNMNLMFGLAEKTGLNLKAIAF